MVFVLLILIVIKIIMIVYLYSNNLFVIFPSIPTLYSDMHIFKMSLLLKID